jgi:hypothetical protein
MRRVPPAALAVVVAGALVVALVRARLATTAERVKQRSDLYALPPTELLGTVSLGYRAAFADLVWAHVLVTQGLRMAEARPFEHLELYLDAVNTLDPKFREPYRLADSLLTFQRNDPNPERSVRAARRILERGLREHPLDAALWMGYGEYLAYIGSPALKDEHEKQSWRMDGARALVRSGELGSRDENLLWHSVSAAGILTKQGQHEARRRLLEQVYAMTEDEELRAHVLNRMGQIAQGSGESRVMLLARRFDALWRADVPFLSRTQFRVLGPAPDTWRCARRPPMGASEPWCTRGWSEWAAAAMRDEPDR